MDGNFRLFVNELPCALWDVLKRLNKTRVALDTFEVKCSSNQKIKACGRQGNQLYKKNKK